MITGCPSAMRTFAPIAMAVLLSVTKLTAQDGLLPFRPIAGLTVGVELPKMEPLSGTVFATKPFVALALDLGVSWTYRERYGVVAMGFFAMNGYDYAKEGYTYDVYHLTQRLELRPFWQKPLRADLGTTLRAALGVGYAFQGASSLAHRDGPFSAFTSAEPQRRLYIAPELSILKEAGRHRMELGLRYVRHLDRTPAFSTMLMLGPDTTLATATHDHLALVFRFHMGLRKLPMPVFPLPSVDFAARTTDTLTTLEVGRERLTLWLWDNAEYDGDTLSVMLNGRPVLVAHELKRKRHKLKLHLLPGENTILIVAHNEGRVSPNTASVLLKAGKGRTRMLVSTSLMRNQLVRVVRSGSP